MPYSGSPQSGAHTVTVTEAEVGSYGAATISTGTPGAVSVHLTLERSGAMLDVVSAISLSSTTGVLTVTGVAAQHLLSGDILYWMVG
jgi:hypothetical protein